ncbi:DUF3307 domain-containing protein [Aliiroseovarius sp. KMU-50]|uniref:DUF3307 domain-containing protein n=1 Tax=Aliiroseovarius salicola TaxID=3009082 RepID=A0ABT4W1E1_9RHOB|nr:DUF3307 domain-containing protein [Aliiroseovarius sp. KMU-50]MDA5094329.1 DUF3307 domain-containing protein [Aliiroseovarius sp. KMU-50]
MLETFLALLVAHLLADFVFQTNTMVREKRRLDVFASHVAVVGAASLFALGGAWEAALIVTIIHAIIDALKTYLLSSHHSRALWAFTVDQVAHLGSIAWVTLLWPWSFGHGIWGFTTPYMAGPAVLVAGFLIATAMGGPIVGGLMRRFPQSFAIQGLKNAGRVIGFLERAFVFFLILFNSPIGIGFLLTAKSVLRFDTTRKGQHASEYVIIGTLASFGWAMGVAFLTKEAFALITP